MSKSSSDTTHIRNYRNSDWKATFQMLIQTMEYHMSIQSPVRFKTYTPELLRNFLRGLTSKHNRGTGKFLLAVDSDHKAIGFIYGEVDKQDKELSKCAVKSGTIVELFVSPESRNQSVAQTLMTKLEEYLSAKGCILIRLQDVHITNQPARKLYAKLGYQPRVLELAKTI